MLNEIKDIDSKDRRNWYVAIIIIYTTLLKWHDSMKTDQSVDIIIIVSNYYIIILTINFVHDLLNITWHSNNGSIKMKTNLINVTKYSRYNMIRDKILI